MVGIVLARIFHRIEIIGVFIWKFLITNISEFTLQVRLFTALQLFEKHKLSLGKAAELAGISKEYFMVEMDKYGIPFINYDPDELNEELAEEL